MESLSIVFEICMVVLFGCSWPFNLMRAYKARTTKGTSLMFTLLIFLGYVGGILSKICAWIAFGNTYWTALRILAFTFYCTNLCMLSAALVIYFRNKRLDKANAAK